MNILSRHLSSENKSFYKSLLFVALPIMGQELLNTGVNLLDSVMVGQLGLDSINGVGFANQIFFLMSVIMFGVTSGAAIFMGQYWGKKDAESIRKVIGLCVSLNMVIALLFGLFAFLSPQTLIGFFTKNPDALQRGVEYIRVAAITYFLFAVTACFNASLRSIGQTRLPMFTTLISMVTNGVLNYVLIFIFHWGVTGAAIATVTARLIELTSMLLLLRHYKTPLLGPIKSYFSATKAFVRAFFKLTLPVIANEATWAIGTTLYTVIYQMCGHEAQGATQITSVIQNMFMVIGFGAGTGCGVLIANRLGAGERDLAISYANKGLKVILVIGFVMSGLLLLGAPLIVMLYDVSDAVRADARRIMYVIALGVVVKNFNYSSIVGVLRSGGDTRFCLYLDLAGVWAIGLPLALFGAAVLHLPIHWVVALVYTEELFKCILSARRVKSNAWANCLV